MKRNKDTFGLIIGVTAMLGFICGFSGVIYLVLMAAATPRNADGPKVVPPSATWVSEQTTTASQTHE